MRACVYVCVCVVCVQCVCVRCYEQCMRVHRIKITGCISRPAKTQKVLYVVSIPVIKEHSIVH